MLAFQANQTNLENLALLGRRISVREGLPTGAFKGLKEGRRKEEMDKKHIKVK